MGRPAIGLDHYQPIRSYASGDGVGAGAALRWIPRLLAGLLLFAGFVFRLADFAFLVALFAGFTLLAPTRKSSRFAPALIAAVIQRG